MAAFRFGHDASRVGAGEDVEHRVAGIGQKANEELRQLRRKPRRMWCHSHSFAGRRVLAVGL